MKQKKISVRAICEHKYFVSNYAIIIIIIINYYVNKFA